MTTIWYLYCHDVHSNEIIAEALQGSQTINEFKHHKCADDTSRPLYIVPDYSFANRYKRSEKALKAKFTIFRSQDGSKPAEWKFPKRETTLDKLKKNNKIRMAAA